MIDKISKMQYALVGWYPFKSGASILYIGENEAISAELKARGFEVAECAASEIVSKKEALGVDGVRYDYIICMDVFEKQEGLNSFFKDIFSALKYDGILLLAMNNRFGIRYFCGDRDLYTDRVMDGIEDYSHYYGEDHHEFSGRMYSKSEIRQLLSEIGFVDTKFYSILSDLEHPFHIFADGVVPNEDLANRIIPTYNSPDTIFLHEERLYDGLLKNGMFHSMANAYLVEAIRPDECERETAGSKANGETKISSSSVRMVTATTDRDLSNSLFTVIDESDTVHKFAAYPEGKIQIDTLFSNTENLRGRGISVIDMKRTDRGVIMPYVDAPTVQKHLQSLLVRDKDAFLKLLDSFMKVINRSSDIAYEDEKYGPIAELGFVDMIPLNCLYNDGKLLFFDQEFVIPNYSLNAIKARVLFTFFAYHDELRDIIPEDELFARYGLLEHKADYDKMEKDALGDIWNDRELGEHWQQARRNSVFLRKNRSIMNNHVKLFNARISDLFEDVEGKECYVFGSGKFAEDFMDIYSMVCPIKNVFDNNPERWGDHIRGVEIVSPDKINKLASMDPDNYRIIICIKNHDAVAQQLENVGIFDYYIYDRSRVYPRKIHIDDRKTEADENSKKPYHIGYISGTFDLFHMGHLNLLRRAKERCDYLIVGVVSDEGVREFKEVEPFIPFEERRQIVEACRYVDEVVEIPLYHRDIRNAYMLYHFDCQFCGSDYYDDPVFMKDRLWLQSLGSNLELLPYTESTSSTKIKELVEKGLLL